MTRIIPVDADALETLNPTECWDLVRSRSIGRFVANRSRAAPLVVPINYVVDPADSAVVFRTGAGSKLNAVAEGIVGMQVDEVDPTHRVGWSVVVEGLARWLYAEHESIDIESWAPGSLPYVVRLTPTRVTGRRIRLDAPDTDARGYR